MKRLLPLLAVAGAHVADADTSCILTQMPDSDPTTLLIRELEPFDQAVILISGRTLLFDCPPNAAGKTLECYGQTEAPMNAPTQLNVASEVIEAGAVVIVTTRNLFFQKNKLLGTNQRHSTVHVFTIQSCERQ